MRLNGAQIKRILSRSVMSLSGLRVKLDVTKPEGKRLVSAVVIVVELCVDDVPNGLGRDATKRREDLLA